MSVEEVLDVIVDRAKLITDTEKAMLVLADEHADGLDLDSMVVRGQRDRHDQVWWQSRLEQLSERLFQPGEIVLEKHVEHQAWLLCCPIMVKDMQIGLLAGVNRSEHPFTRMQQDFYSILVAFAGSAIENARLAEETRYVLLASERDRIAREMHDGVVQSLFSISLGLEVCKRQVYTDQSACARRLDELQQHLNTSMSELRRFIYDLRPAKLTELGLVGATEYWVREVTLGRGIRGRVTVEGKAPHLTPSQEACLYRVAKEAVSNVVRHSGADRFDVRISFTSESARVEIRDSGKGFDACVVGEGSARQIGLVSLAQRVEREGGDFSVESVLGEGTTVSVEIEVEGREQ